MSSGPFNSNRARRLTLTHQAQPIEAWIASASEADLASLAPATYLSAAEVEQAKAFRFDPRRRSYLLGRLAAKMALSALLGEPSLPQIGVSWGVFGQPLVSHPCWSDAEISLSHSQGLAVALAFPRGHPMGLDVESIEDARAATARDELRLLPAEQGWVASSAVEPRAAYILLWTAREALSKVLRCGLNCPFEVLGLAGLRPLEAAGWESTYQNFHQYKCLSWIGARRVLSIALPQATEVWLPESMVEYVGMG